MSKIKHTPGPWTICRTTDGAQILGIADEDAAGITDYRLGLGLWRAGAEREANAHLIAAAPDLKRELERLREIVVDAVARGMIEACPEVDAALHCSAEAIDKAGGYSDA